MPEIFDTHGSLDSMAAAIKYAEQLEKEKGDLIMATQTNENGGIKLYRLTQGTYTQLEGKRTKVYIAGTSNDKVPLTEKAAKRLGPSFELIEEEEESEEEGEGERASVVGGEGVVGVAAPTDDTISNNDLTTEVTNDTKALEEFLVQSVVKIKNQINTFHDPVVLSQLYEMEEKKGKKARADVLTTIRERYEDVQEEQNKG